VRDRRARRPTFKQSQHGTQYYLYGASNGQCF
jgi:hypothetical protein